MDYQIEYKPHAIRDIKALPRDIARRVYDKVEGMRHELHGDVKKLHGEPATYRLRVGDYRVFFVLQGSRAIIYQVKHRREAY